MIPELLKEKKGKDKLLTIGLFAMLFALLFASVLLYFRLQKRVYLRDQQEVQIQEREAEEGLPKTYRNEEFGFKVLYPDDFVTREIESNSYQKYVLFIPETDYSKRGFAVTVGENSLEDEVLLLKNQILKDSQAELESEGDYLFEDIKAKMLSFVPADKQTSELEPKTVVIIPKDEFTYGISARPEDIETALSYFGFTD